MVRATKRGEKLLEEMRIQLEKDIHAVVCRNEYSHLSEQQREELKVRSLERLARTKWVDEHVIATDLMLIQYENPDIFPPLK
ncbi:hypothetical protein ACQZV8_13575 [Magnetococcales bacterium HHB-1]